MLCEQHQPGAVDGGGGAGRHRQHDRLPGAARTQLESQLQRAVKVSAKGKHVKCKMDLERCLFWDTAGNRAPRPAEFVRRRGRALVEARHVWLMARQWGVLFEVRRLMLEPLERGFVRAGVLRQESLVLTRELLVGAVLRVAQVLASCLGFVPHPGVVELPDRLLDGLLLPPQTRHVCVDAIARSKFGPLLEGHEAARAHP